MSYIETEVLNLNKSISWFRNNLAENKFGNQKSSFKYNCSPKYFTSNEKSIFLNERQILLTQISSKTTQ